MDKLLSNLHLFVFLWAAYSLYVAYDEHFVRKTELDEQLAVVTEEQAKKEVEVLEVEKYREDMARLQEDMGRVSAEIEKVQKQLPASTSDIEILDLLTLYGTKLNMRDVVLNRLSARDEKIYTVNQYEFKATGTYLQFLIFLERLSQADRLFNVASLNFLKQEEESRGRFQLLNGTIVVETYNYNASYNKELLEVSSI